MRVAPPCSASGEAGPSADFGKADAGAETESDDEEVCFHYILFQACFKSRCVVTNMSCLVFLMNRYTIPLVMCLWSGTQISLISAMI